jgi:Na+-transporting methylmalonyl-CoA/oxaloacetate decarboxylase gamma subunit
MTPFDKVNMLKSLEIMWKGMLAIFVVIVIIVLITYITNYFINKSVIKKEKSIQDDKDK